VTDLVDILHAIRDDVLLAIGALERGDEVAALEALELAASRAREALDGIRA
jgi:hypothetical protein